MRAQRTQIVAKDQVFRNALTALVGIDHALGGLADRDAALLRFELKATVGGRLVEVEALHQEPLGALDELARFEGLTELFLVRAGLLQFFEAPDRHRDRRAQRIMRDRLDQISKYARGSGARISGA